MIHRISLSEANQHLSHYIEIVEHGGEIIITRRGQPVARLIAIERKRKLSRVQQETWKQLKAKMRKGINLGGKRLVRDVTHER